MSWALASEQPQAGEEAEVGGKKLQKVQAWGSETTQKSWGEGGSKWGSRKLRVRKVH